MMRCSTRTRHLLALSGLSLASAATGLAPIADGDIFWHLAGGREMWRSGQLLTQDLFSVGAAGRAWTDAHWFVRRQELPKALRYLTRAVARDPFDLEATRLLRLLEERSDAH